MLSLDSETTGVDLRHGAKPFLVTTCNEEGENTFWEFDVDPLTREPQITEEDITEIGDFLFADGPNQFIFQNGKFDITALDQIGLFDNWDLDEIWKSVDDTLIAAHLLASNQPHDLTSLALIYLDVNIKPLEEALHKAVKEARRIAAKKYPDWRIAKKGMPDGPSVGYGRNNVAGADYWLPRAIAKAEEYAADHPWWTVCSEYANADSAVTLPLWKVMRERLKKRDLLKHYAARMKVVPVGQAMEDYGITLSKKRMDELRVEYKKTSAKNARVCVNIAKSLGHDLVLPKNGVNNSLRTFCFDVLKLEPVINHKSKTKAPTLDAKNAMPYYFSTLPANSKALLFLRTLSDKRSRDTALSYMDGYERFWVPLGKFNSKGEQLYQLWYRLHPSLNPTGTDTLRWSSSNPNEQNISKKESFNLRYMFGPAPGREWWSCDAKNIELRIPAYESGEQLLIDLFEKPDEPPYYGSEHILNFSVIWPEIWKQGIKEVGIENVGPWCKKKYAATNYQWTKNGDFSIQYGSVDKADGTGTADKAFHKKGAHSQLRSRFAKKEALNKKWIDFANRHGYIETMPSKAIDPMRGYPLLCTRTHWGGIKPTIPLSYHVQGTAMEWMQQAMVRVHSYLQEYNENRKPEYQAHLVMQVHDELVFDFPKSKVSPTEVKDWKTDKFKYLRTNLPAIRNIQKLMEIGGLDINVPTPTSCCYHEVSWSEGVDV